MKMSEAKLQAEFFKLVNNDPFFRYCIWSTPNDAFLGNDTKQRAIQANKLKATGLLKGVWDLTIQKNSKLFFIELPLYYRLGQTFTGTSYSMAVPTS